LLTPALPVGIQRLHPSSFVNYQLNRLHACGFAEAEEMREAVRGRRSFVAVAEALARLSERAEAEGRLRQAAAYQRGAEFFTPQRSPERVRAYRRYRELFDRAFADAGFTRHEVPYEKATLPAYRLPSLEGPARGTVLLHGGFDSLIEEFYVIWERVAAAGFDVIAFEGPGQGGARILGGLTFDHDWEKPVAAVLDFFELEEADLVGISMGGYWALRAAGREPRIRHVVSWPPVYDWMAVLSSPLQSLVRWMVGFRRPMNWTIRLRMRLFPILAHAVNHTLFLVDGKEPMDAVDFLMGMNPEHLGSERVTQDVLLMVGEHDAFQSPALANAQEAALTNARSITRRVFSKSEHADGHCQMGNLDLACSVLTAWLRKQHEA